MPPEVLAHEPDSADPISIVSVVEVGIDVTIKVIPLKSSSSKFELVIDEKLSK